MYCVCVSLSKIWLWAGVGPIIGYRHSPSPKLWPWTWTYREIYRITYFQAHKRAWTPANTCGLLGPTSKCQCQAQPRTKSRSTNGKLIVPWERTGVWVAAGYPQCTDSEFLWIKWNTADLSSERHEGPVDLSCTVHSCSLRVQPELHPSCQGPKSDQPAVAVLP